MGYRAVLYPLTAFRAAMRAAEETLRELRDRGTQRGRSAGCRRGPSFTTCSVTGLGARDRAYFSAGVIPRRGIDPGRG